MEIITSRDNAHAKRLAALLSSKKEREAAGLFVAEGLRLGQEAAAHTRLCSLLLTPEAAGRYPAARELTRKAEQVVWLDSALARRIADTKTTQGIFCVCEMLDNGERAVTIKNSGKFLLLSGLQDPGNLGACVRTAAALGLSGLFLHQCCELYSPKTLRASMGAAFYTPIRVCSRLEGILGSLRDAGIPVYAAAVHPGSKRVQDVDFSGGAAALVGNEGNGLPRELVEACDASVVIPMAEHAESLNAAVASAILLWEMVRGQGGERV